MRGLGESELILASVGEDEAFAEDRQEDFRLLQLVKIKAAPIRARWLQGGLWLGGQGRRQGGLFSAESHEKKDSFFGRIT